MKPVRISTFQLYKVGELSYSSLGGKEGHINI